MARTMDDVHYRIGHGLLVLAVGDITTERTDAIVNAANSSLLSGGGVDGAIHRAAGPRLLEACRRVKKGLPDGLLATGRAAITPGFCLPARYVIHTVRPIYGPGAAAPAHLASCYRESMRLARRHGLASIAFPAISTGAFGYPADEAAAIALDVLAAELRGHDRPDLVRLILYDRAAFEICRAGAE